MCDKVAFELFYKDSRLICFQVKISNLQMETLPNSVPELLFMAKLAEHCERFDEMVRCIKAVVALKGAEAAPVRLSADERNLLSVAFKNVIGTRRVSWRTLFALEHKERENGDAASKEHVPILTAYREVVEREIQDICGEVDALVADVLLPAVGADEVTPESAEVRVFYLKMQGDYHRYRAETTAAGEASQQCKDKALAAYSEALELAAPHLNATHPIRLGLVLNFSVFHYEILKDAAKGVEMAKAAFDEGVKGIEALDEEAYKESSLILHLLRDNLMLWKEDAPEDHAVEAKLSNLKLDIA